MNRSNRSALSGPWDAQVCQAPTALPRDAAVIWQCLRRRTFSDVHAPGCQEKIRDRAMTFFPFVTRQRCYVDLAVGGAPVWAMTVIFFRSCVFRGSTVAQCRRCRRRMSMMPRDNLPSRHHCRSDRQPTLPAPTATQPAAGATRITATAHQQRQSRRADTVHQHWPHMVELETTITLAGERYLPPCYRRRAPCTRSAQASSGADHGSMRCPAFPSMMTSGRREPCPSSKVMTSGYRLLSALCYSTQRYPTATSTGDPGQTLVLCEAYPPCSISTACARHRIAAESSRSVQTGFLHCRRGRSAGVKSHRFFEQRTSALPLKQA